MKLSSGKVAFIIYSSAIIIGWSGLYFLYKAYTLQETFGEPGTDAWYAAESECWEKGGTYKQVSKINWECKFRKP